jgi:hypothetical protein
MSVSGYITGKRDLILGIQVFWDVTLCGWESGSRRWRHYNPVKHRDYTFEHMAQFGKILVRTQNIALVTVAPVIQGTQRNILNKFPNVSHSAHKWAIHFPYTVHQLSRSTGLITSSNVSILVYFQQGYQRSNNNLKKTHWTCDLVLYKVHKTRTWHKEVHFEDTRTSVSFLHLLMHWSIQIIVFTRNIQIANCFWHIGLIMATREHMT